MVVFDQFYFENIVPSLFSSHRSTPHQTSTTTERNERSNTMARKLDNKIALVTGATSGIGLATAQASRVKARTSTSRGAVRPNSMPL